MIPSSSNFSGVNFYSSQPAGKRVAKTLVKFALAIQVIGCKGFLPKVRQMPAVDLRCGGHNSRLLDAALVPKREKSLLAAMNGFDDPFEDEDFSDVPSEQSDSDLHTSFFKELRKRETSQPDVDRIFQDFLAAKQNNVPSASLQEQMMEIRQSLTSLTRLSVAHSPSESERVGRDLASIRSRVDAMFQKLAEVTPGELSSMNIDTDLFYDLVQVCIGVSESQKCETKVSDLFSQIFDSLSQYVDKLVPDISVYQLMDGAFKALNEYPSWKSSSVEFRSDIEKLGKSVYQHHIETLDGIVESGANNVYLFVKEIGRIIDSVNIILGVTMEAGGLNHNLSVDMEMLDASLMSVREAIERTEEFIVSDDLPDLDIGELLDLEGCLLTLSEQEALFLLMNGDFEAGMQSLEDGYKTRYLMTAQIDDPFMQQAVIDYAQNSLDSNINNVAEIIRIAVDLCECYEKEKSLQILLEGLVLNPYGDSVITALVDATKESGLDYSEASLLSFQMNAYERLALESGDSGLDKVFGLLEKSLSHANQLAQFNSSKSQTWSITLLFKMIDVLCGSLDDESVSNPIQTDVTLQSLHQRLAEHLIDYDQGKGLFSEAQHKALENLKYAGSMDDVALNVSVLLQPFQVIRPYIEGNIDRSL